MKWDLHIAGIPQIDESFRPPALRTHSLNSRLLCLLRSLTFPHSTVPAPALLIRLQFVQPILPRKVISAHRQLAAHPRRRVLGNSGGELRIFNLRRFMPQLFHELGVEHAEASEAIEIVGDGLVPVVPGVEGLEFGELGAGVVLSLHGRQYFYNYAKKMDASVKILKLELLLVRGLVQPPHFRRRLQHQRLQDILGKAEHQRTVVVVQLDPVVPLLRLLEQHLLLALLHLLLVELGVFSPGDGVVVEV